MGNFNPKQWKSKVSSKAKNNTMTKRLLCKCGRLAKYKCDFCIESTLLRNTKVPLNYPDLEPYFHSSRPNIGFRKSSLQINLYISCDTCIKSSIKDLFDYSSKGWSKQNLNLTS